MKFNEDVSERLNELIFAVNETWHVSVVCFFAFIEFRILILGHPSIVCLFENLPFFNEINISSKKFIT